MPHRRARHEPVSYLSYLVTDICNAYGNKTCKMQRHIAHFSRLQRSHWRAAAAAAMFSGKGRCLPPFLDDSGIKRLRALLEDDGDGDVRAMPSARVHASGHHVRAGGWKPTTKQNPGLSGIKGAGQKWWESKCWKLLEDVHTADDSCKAGQTFRNFTGMPRSVFDEWATEAAECDLIADHHVGDGQLKKGPPTIPLKLKLMGEFALTHL